MTWTQQFLMNSVLLVALLVGAIAADVEPTPLTLTLLSSHTNGTAFIRIKADGLPELPAFSTVKCIFNGKTKAFAQDWNSETFQKFEKRFGYPDYERPFLDIAAFTVVPGDLYVHCACGDDKKMGMDTVTPQTLGPINFAEHVSISTAGRQGGIDVNVSLTVPLQSAAVVQCWALFLQENDLHPINKTKFLPANLWSAETGKARSMVVKKNILHVPGPWSLTITGLQYTRSERYLLSCAVSNAPSDPVRGSTLIQADTVSVKSPELIIEDVGEQVDTSLEFSIMRSDSANFLFDDRDGSKNDDQIRCMVLRSDLPPPAKTELWAIESEKVKQRGWVNLKDVGITNKVVVVMPSLSTGTYYGYCAWSTGGDLDFFLSSQTIWRTKETYTISAAAASVTMEPNPAGYGFVSTMGRADGGYFSADQKVIGCLTLPASEAAPTVFEFWHVPRTPGWNVPVAPNALALWRGPPEYTELSGKWAGFQSDTTYTLYCRFSASDKTDNVTDLYVHSTGAGHATVVSTRVGAVVSVKHAPGAADVLVATVKREDGMKFTNSEISVGCLTKRDPAGAAITKEQVWYSTRGRNPKGYLTIVDVAGGTEMPVRIEGLEAASDWVVACAFTQADVEADKEALLATSTSVAQQNALTIEPRVTVYMNSLGATEVSLRPHSQAGAMARCLLAASLTDLPTGDAFWTVDTSAYLGSLEQELPLPEGGITFGEVPPATQRCAACAVAVVGMQSAIATECVTTGCPAGQGSESPHAPKCIQCPPNTYSPETTSPLRCIACVEHSVSEAGSASCQCKAGYKRTEDGFCAACPAGTYKEAVGEGACVECPEHATSEPGATSCLCAKGHYSSSGKCVPCAAGTYKPTMGDTGCEKCEEHAMSAAGAPACLCAAGYQRVEGVCAACEAGKFKTANMSDASCGTCPQNSVSPSPARDQPCLPCPAATYTGIVTANGTDLPTTTCFCNATADFIPLQKLTDTCKAPGDKVSAAVSVAPACTVAALLAFAWLLMQRA